MLIRRQRISLYNTSFAQKNPVMEQFTGTEKEGSEIRFLIQSVNVGAKPIHVRSLIMYFLHTLSNAFFRSTFKHAPNFRYPYREAYNYIVS